jgi:hypothetical protein
MCAHENALLINDEIVEEKWEGDFYTQKFYSWYHCQECGSDLSISLA